jgi:hypothetical protein
MVRFTATIKQFGQQGEKTGWTYIEVPPDIAQHLKAGARTSFRVRGKLDSTAIKQIALLPMGGGTFIMALNADIRKAIKKRKGSRIDVQIEEDDSGFVFNKDFMTCLADDPEARKFFKSLPGSHQRYFSKWIDSAKTTTTREKRIARAVSALARKMGYAEMVREGREY